MRRFRSPRRLRPRGLTLSPDWQRWVADNLLAGAPPDALRAALLARDVPPAEADAQLAAIAASPAFLAAQRPARAARRLALVARLHQQLAAQRDAPTSVERAAGLAPAAFFERYYATNTPVVLTDVVTSWPAFGRWTPAFLKQRFGHVEVMAATGRAADPDCDLHTPALSRPMKLGEFVDRVLAAGESNDLYLVANHRNSDRDALRPLFDDVTLPAGILDPARLRGATAFWFGPAGTVTPLHHDTSNILFGNVFGEKRFLLVAPWETSLLESTRGVYSLVDPERPDPARFPDFARATVREVTLRPGEMLFLPVGWWHHVRALSVSINLAFTNFTRNNAFDWYRPGERG
jgi:hypothetical protein